MNKKSSPPKRSTSKSKPSRAGKTESIDVNKSTSTSIRQIENGFIVTESGYKGTGKNQRYFSKDMYSATNPIAGLKLKLGGRK